MKTIKIGERQLYQLIENAIKSVAKKRLNEGCNDRSRDWCGIKGIYFIWHGEWADPELEYNGFVVNYHDVVDHYWKLYKEDYPKPDEMSDKEYEEGFNRYLNFYADDIVTYIVEYGEPMDDDEEEEDDEDEYEE